MSEAMGDFRSLPLEVVQRVIDECFKIDSAPLHSDPSKFPWRRQTPYYRPSAEQEDTAVGAMSRTCKSLRALSLPILYDYVDFIQKDNAAVGRWIDLCMDKYGHYVNRLWIRSSIFENKLWGSTIADDDRGVERWDPQTRGVLVVKLLTTLPSLHSIDVDLLYIYPPSHCCTDGQCPTCRDVSGYRTQILGITGHKLHTTHLAISAASSDPEFPDNDTLCAILEELPNLECIELSYFSETPCTERLLDVLAGNSRLKQLDLWNCSAVTDSWPKRQWRSQLELLKLQHCEEIGEAAVDEWLQQLSSSIKYLVLTVPPWHFTGEAVTLNGGQMFDMPQLRYLEVEVGHCDIAFLSRFALCDKLRCLRLGSHTMIDSAKVCDMITKYCDGSAGGRAGFVALEELQLKKEWRMQARARVMKRLASVCAAYAIELSILSRVGGGDTDDINSADESDDSDDSPQE